MLPYNSNINKADDDCSRHRKGPKKQTGGMHRSSAETDRQKEGSRTNLWRECISIAYVAKTNWQMDREIDVQGNGMFISFFCIATSQSPSLLETLTTACNLRMCLMALLMICVISRCAELCDESKTKNIRIE